MNFLLDSFFDRFLNSFLLHLVDFLEARCFLTACVQTFSEMVLATCWHDLWKVREEGAFGPTSKADPLNKKAKKKMNKEATKINQLPSKEVTNKINSAMDLPCGWKSLLTCIVNLAAFVSRYVHLIKDGGLLVDPQVVQKFDERSMCIFLVDK